MNACAAVQCLFSFTVPKREYLMVGFGPLTAIDNDSFLSLSPSHSVGFTFVNHIITAMKGDHIMVLRKFKPNAKYLYHKFNYYWKKKYTTVIVLDERSFSWGKKIHFYHI